MAAKKKELDARLQDLAARHDALTETVRQLATHTAVLALAVRDRDTVPPTDLDVALAGIADISSTLRTRPG